MKRYETYKDSGILWLDAIPSHWHEEKLKHISTCNDEVLSEDTPDELIIHYVEISDVDSVSGINNHTDYTFANAPSRARRIARKNDVIISTVRTYLKAIATVKEDDLIVSTGFAVIRPTKVNQKYLAYSLLNDDFLGEVISKSVGVSYPAINATDLIEIKIPVPPREEQETIATYLDRKVSQIDATIAEKEQMLEDLKAYRSAIISEAVTKGLDKNVEMKDSGIEWLGMIPKHWGLVKLKNKAKVNGRIGFRGYTTADLVPKGQGAYTIGGKHITNCVLDLSNPDFISWDKYYESPEIMVKKGDILMAQRGSLGKAALVREDIGDATINPSLVLLNSIAMNEVFLYYYLVSSSCLAYIDLLNTATAVPMISQNQIENIFVPIPSGKEQKQIADYLDRKTKEIDETTIMVSTQISDLKSYKSALITEAVTGKIDLREWKPKEENV